MSTMREIKDCENNDPTCSTCTVTKDGACNTYNYPSNRRKCVQCNGGVECEKQVADAISISKASRYCENPFDNCVSLNDRGNYTFACEATMSRRDQLFCEEHPQSCVKCTGDECNRTLPPKHEDIKCAATIAGASTVMTVMMIGVIAMVFKSEQIPQI